MSHPLFDAILEGAARGREDKARADAAAARESERYAAAFNAAGRVLEGLEIIKGLEGSRVDYSLSGYFERAAAPRACLRIETNIPVTLGFAANTEPLSLVVKEDGEARAWGDWRREAHLGREMAEGNVLEDGGAARLVSFIARYAARRGMMP